MTKFLVLSLPRSRSAWMSHWLRYAGKVVTHDLAVECASVADFRAKLELVDGSCETGAVIGWRLIREQMPETRLVVVHRPWGQVADSLTRQGIELSKQIKEDLIARAIMLEQVSALPGVLSLSYPQLSDPSVCQVLWEFCLELPFDWQWWQKYSEMNIQVNMPARLARLVLNHDRLEALKAEIALAGPRYSEGAPCYH